MSNGTDATALLRSVPLFGAARFLSWAEMPGGLSNRSLKVQTEEGDFVLRMPAPASPHWPGQSIEAEWRVLVAASAAGLAAEPVWLDAQRRWLVTRYLHGPVWSATDIRNSASWPALTDMLRRVHALEADVPDLDLFAAAKFYWARITARGKPDAQARRLWDEFCEHGDAMASELPPAALCHNDIMHTNVHGERSPRLLDWEFAARADPLFDLATIVVYHDFSDADAGRLLEIYLGGRDHGQRRRLAVACRLCRYVSWFWSRARQTGAPVRAWSVTPPG